MKKLSIFLFAAILAMAACDTEEKVILLNSDNLDNWSIFLPDSIDKSSVFKVENDILSVSGIPNGYIKTRDKYTEYKLHVEWRWTDKPTNSGVLLHASGEDMIWPNCIEAQLMAGKAGDLVLIGKGAGITVNGTASIIESEEKRYAVLAKMKESSENEAGEWNTYDITVTAESIELVVNGVVQNTGTNPTKTEGYICLQSEGSPMEFRNIYLIPLQ